MKTARPARERAPDGQRFWLTPEYLRKWVEKRYGKIQLDPCPYPRPDGYDGLKAEWSKFNYVNPPFRAADGDGIGPTAWVHKAIAEHWKGNATFLTLPTQLYVMLLAAIPGVEIVSLDRVRWEECESGKPMSGPSPICGFYLPGAKQPTGKPRGSKATRKLRAAEVRVRAAQKELDRALAHLERVAGQTNLLKETP